MLGMLSLGVCIACISCLCCLCTATVIAIPDLIDLRRVSKLHGKREQQSEAKGASEHAFCPAKKVGVVFSREGSEGFESETCRCATTWDLLPIVKSPNCDCGNVTRRRNYCKCPSFSELVTIPASCPVKLHPRIALK